MTGADQPTEASNGSPPGNFRLSDGLGRLRERLLAYSDIRQRDPRESRDALSALLTDELLRIEREQARLTQAMAVLRQIAGMQRRTREQRLASSCVAFLDSLDERPNVELSGRQQRGALDSERKMGREALRSMASAPRCWRSA